MTVSSRNRAVDIGRFRYQGLGVSYIWSEDLSLWRGKINHNLNSINWFNSERSQLDMILVFTFTGGSQVSWLPRIRRIDRRFHVRWSSPAKEINENNYQCRTETRIYQLLDRQFPSFLVPLFQSESKCETILMKMSSASSFIFMQIKLIFIRMVSHLDSLWNRGTRELGNGLFALPPFNPSFTAK